MGLKKKRKVKKEEPEEDDYLPPPKPSKPTLGAPKLISKNVVKPSFKPKPRDALEIEGSDSDEAPK